MSAIPKFLEIGREDGVFGQTIWDAAEHGGKRSIPVDARSERCNYHAAHFDGVG